MSFWKLPALGVCLLLGACAGPIQSVPDEADGTDPNTAPAETGTGTDTDTDATGGGDGTLLSGRIVAPAAAKRAPRAQQADAPYAVLAQSNTTGEIYRGLTDAEGNFAVDIPDSEAGATFMVTILSPEGRTVGPVLFGEVDGSGVTGLEVDGEVSLGTVQLPEDPTAAPIGPGDDADELDELIDPNVAARLNANGAPLGLGSCGKGAETRAAAAEGPPVDPDRDGLPDVLDADDDGDGFVDDFEGDGDVGGLPDDIRVNFFMNLKIAAENAPTYYGGTSAEIADALATDTVITFECLTEPGATRAITGAHMLETPGPSYLPIAEKMDDDGTGPVSALWSDSDYAFDKASDRFQAFVRPNAVMDAGDTFTVEVSFDDGTTAQYSRMINYIFKNIPRLVQHGTPGALRDFDVSDPNANGTWEHPIPFDGAEDLVLVFRPPLDEDGNYLTALDYSFQIFYYSAADDTQLNSEIDSAATWPSPPDGFSGTTYWVSNDELELAPDNTYTVTLPAELLPDTVQLQDASVAAVGRYKIDITAECSSGNAAITLMFVKQ